MGINVYKYIGISISTGDRDRYISFVDSPWMKIYFPLCSITEEALLVPKEKSSSAFKKIH